MSEKSGALRRRPPRLLQWVLVALLVLMASVGVAACGGGDSSSSDAQGEVVITCANCTATKASPFDDVHADMLASFNTKYAGKYRIKAIKSQFNSGGDRLQYYQRLALANNLPDLFTVNPAEVASLYRTGKLMDFKSALDDDSAWRDAFYDGAFDATDDAQGHVWAIPETRDAIGIYWNKQIFKDAGVGSFPQTWDELDAACKKIAATGKSCLAMDGDWTTLLMWANLIGTDPDGADFLTRGIGEGDYASNAAVVKATDRLKAWHTDGLTNTDAFSGEYQNAATAFVRGQAAMIANGPWMVNSDIKKKTAVKDLYGMIGYEASPGWTSDGRGLVVLAGQGSWASGAKDERKQEAVLAWLKFCAEHPQQFEQVQKTGSYTATKITLTAAEKQKVDPLAANLVEQSGSLPHIYPNAYFASPAGFEDAWKNLWPAYAKGKLDTKGFLDKLSEDVTSPTG